MKVVVTAEGKGLDAPVSPIFGRCPVYVFVDTETMEAESVPNPAQAAAGGAGIQAAQFVLSQGARALLTGNVGPNAAGVLSAGGMEIYLVQGGSVREVVEAFKAGKLPKASGATAASHAGIRGASDSSGGRQEVLSALAEEVAELRRRLAEIMSHIEALEKEE